MAKRADGFLNQIIDYAGTFPPAALPADQAVANYLGFMNSRDGWIVENLAWLVKDLNILEDLFGKRVAIISEKSLMMYFLKYKIYHRRQVFQVWLIVKFGKLE